MAHWARAEAPEAALGGSWAGSVHEAAAYRLPSEVEPTDEKREKREIALINICNLITAWLARCRRWRRALRGLGQGRWACPPVTVRTNTDLGLGTRFGPGEKPRAHSAAGLRGPAAVSYTHLTLPTKA